MKLNISIFYTTVNALPVNRGENSRNLVRLGL